MDLQSETDALRRTIDEMRIKHHHDLEKKEN
jgi:hypothetical protein